MEVLEYAKAVKRMCLSFGFGCKGCPLKGKSCDNVMAVTEEYVQAIERWVNDNPEEVK